MNTNMKRINIVSLKMVKERIILYGTRKINSPKDAFELVKIMLGDEDREKSYCHCFRYEESTY